MIKRFLLYELHVVIKIYIFKVELILPLPRIFISTFYIHCLAAGSSLNSQHLRRDSEISGSSPIWNLV